MSESNGNLSPSRRTFLQASAAAGVVATGLASATPVHAAGSDTLKVGLIGCGGRGSGAAANAMRADSNAKLTVMCDVFADRAEQSRKVLGRTLGDQLAVTDENMFSGFDGFKQVMASDVDVVILTTPPHFRPEHLAAAIEAGKHVFCEKPVAVDGPGVRSVLETAKKAKEKNLNLVSGLCWRYDLGVRATMEQIKEGAIGEVLAIQENYLTGTLWHRGHKEEWSDMEYQMRNWLYFTWLSGDHITEQHIHSLDKALWLMGDKPPAKCVGLGGREVRDGEQWGNVFDHFASYFEWDNGVKCHSYTRQMAGCMRNTEDYIVGENGTARILAHEVKSGGDTWKYDGPKPSMYDQEHVELFAAIRNGETINNGEYMSYSTLMAIMGREACYTGKEITFEQALNSTTKLGPDKYEWGPAPEVKVAVPGVTKFV